MRSGILLIDKPAGITSAGVVGRVKWLLKAEKVGHAGTLDPDATGLLIILVNGATKVASYAADGVKRYSGVIRLGVTTSTDDLAGETISESELIPEFTEVAAAARAFLGAIEQTPPRVSAVKIGGRRAHDRARRGEEFEIKPRSVQIDTFELAPISRDQIRYHVECSPGTYVRSLARDLGSALGCGGAVESIRREASGGFKVDDAINLEEVSWDGLREWLPLLPNVSCVALPSAQCEALLNGRQDALKILGRRDDFIALSSGQIVAYRAEDGAEPLGLLKKMSDGEVVIQVNVERSLS